MKIVQLSHGCSIIKVIDHLAEQQDVYNRVCHTIFAEVTICTMQLWTN